VRQQLCRIMDRWVAHGKTDEKSKHLSRVSDPDPYWLSCWIRIRISNTDPDPRVLSGFNFEKNNLKKNRRKFLFSFFYEMKTIQFLYNGLVPVLINIKPNLKVPVLSNEKKRGVLFGINR
jgi:hypothetical protein